MDLRGITGADHNTELLETRFVERPKKKKRLSGSSEPHLLRAARSCGTNVDETERQGKRLPFINYRWSQAEAESAAGAEVLRLFTERLSAVGFFNMNTKAHTEH